MFISNYVGEQVKGGEKVKATFNDRSKVFTQVTTQLLLLPYTN